MDHSIWEERLLNWLQLFLLPALHRRLTTFSLSLSLPALQKEPESQLKLVLVYGTRKNSRVSYISSRFPLLPSVQNPCLRQTGSMTRTSTDSRPTGFIICEQSLLKRLRKFFENRQLGSHPIDHIKLSPAAFNLRNDVDFQGDWLTLAAVEAVEAVLGSITGPD
ncbi:hypothetical protein H4Q26_007574 [Puccinia striiformis f. sp. tritici PST-130]|nr:hypothetical protein H4Q26_007574 [Puccinia striiformis f. sp. tritici PST-130]